MAARLPTQAPAPCAPPTPAPAACPALVSGHRCRPRRKPCGGPRERAQLASPSQVGAFLSLLLPLSLLCPSPPPGAQVSTAGRQAGPGTGADRWSQGECATALSTFPPSAAPRRDRPSHTLPFPRCLQEASSHSAPPDAPWRPHFPGHPGRIQGTCPPRLPGESPEWHWGLATPARPALHSGPSSSLAQWAEAGLAESLEKEPLPHVKPSPEGCALYGALPGPCRAGREWAGSPAAEAPSGPSLGLCSPSVGSSVGEGVSGPASSQGRPPQLQVPSPKPRREVLRPSCHKAPAAVTQTGAWHCPSHLDCSGPGGPW